MEMWLIWLIFAGALAVVEIMTLGLTTVWFAVGALAACVLSLINISLWAQVLSFLAVSGLLLYFTKPIVENYLKVGVSRTNADRNIGKEAVVIEKIDVINGKGKVKVAGQVWSAKMEEGEKAEEGERVFVKEIQGVKLVVTKEKEEE